MKKALQLFLGCRPTSTARDRRGVVSTYVSMGIMSVLGLISIAFASVMQTEYSQARDRQLNTQARIGAETAINDARQLIYREIHGRLNAPNIADDLLQRPYDTLGVDEWFDCGDINNNRGGFEGDLDEAIGSNIEYTCVEVDGRPIRLVYDDIDTDRSKNILLQTRRLHQNAFSRSNIDKILINWEGQNAPDLTQLKDAATHNQKLQELTGPNAWNRQAPMLRIQIIPLNLKQGWTQEALNEWSRTFFLYPTKYSNAGIDNAAKVSIYGTSSADSSLIVNADCDSGETLACAVEISGFDNGTAPYPINNELGDPTNTWLHPNSIGNLGAHHCETDGALIPNLTCVPRVPPGTTVPCASTPNSSCDLNVTNGTHDEMAYILLVRSIYDKAKAEISAFASNGDELRFVNQQINVTATGRSGGLTYRLREVIPIRPKYNRPEYAIDSAEHICKVLIGEPTTGISFDHIEVLAYTDPIGVLPPQIKAFCEKLHPS